MTDAERYKALLTVLIDDIGWQGRMTIAVELEQLLREVIEWPESTGDVPGGLREAYEVLGLTIDEWTLRVIEKHESINSR